MIKYHTFEVFLIVCHARAGVHETVVILISELVVRQDFVGIDVIEHVRVHLLGDDGCENGQNGQQAEARSTHDDFIGVVRNSCRAKLNISIRLDTSFIACTYPWRTVFLRKYYVNSRYTSDRL